MTNKRLFSLDIARAFAMIWIVGFWHLSDNSLIYGSILHNQNYSFIFAYLTASTLSTFMFISSYLLSKRYTFITPYETKKFFKKRIIRIIPLMALSMLSLPNSLFPYWNFLTKFLNLIGIAGYISFQLVPTLWFISVLISFYMLLPLIVKQRTIYKKILISIILEIIFLIGNEFCFIEDRISLYFPSFALGIILSDSNILLPQNRSLFYKITFTTTSLFVILMFIPTVRIYVGAFVGFIPIIALSTFLERLVYNKFIYNITSFFSYTSLTAYMFHRQIFIAFYHIGFPPDGIIRIVFLYLIVMPIVFISSYVIQFLYDRVINSFIAKGNVNNL